MNATTSKFSESLRIVWAIAAKDILDARKNKAILQIVVMMLVMVVFYRLTPVVTHLADVPTVHLYDADDSLLAVQLENSPNLDVVRRSSRQAVDVFLVMGGAPELGLVIPSGVDQALEAGEAVQLDGYVQHWVGDAEAKELGAQVEREIVALYPEKDPAVHINLDGHKVYPQPNSMGPGLWAAMTLVMALSMLGLSLVPTLMLEEKHTKTLEALMVSPANSWQVVMGKAAAGLVYCLAGFVVVLAFNAFLISQWGLAISAAVSGAVLAVALGLLLGTIFETKQALSMWTIILTLVLIIPVVVAGMAMDLPETLNNVLRWLPNVALSRLFQLSFSNTAAPAEYGLDLALVIGLTACVLAVVAWRVRRLDR
jgi:ABC-2 type transport system permease protein